MLSSRSRVVKFSSALAVATMLLASNGASAADSVDFRNDVMAVLTMNGCNAGACHGAAIGRGGFKLSLYGGNPAADYDAIAREVSGRRVNLSEPDKSLCVLKPTEHIEHGGGTVFDMQSASAQILLRWIRQGANDDSKKTLSRVDISPKRVVIPAIEATVPLRAMAHYTDGSQKDVTAWTIFTPEDKSAISVRDAGSDSPTASPQRRGRHLVVARYLSEVVPLEIVVPLSEKTFDPNSLVHGNFIDDEILKGLATLGIPPSPSTDDAAFLRRATLDLTGRLPTPQRVREFLADPGDSKRNALIDQLLASEAFVEYWTFQLAKLLRIRPQPTEKQGAVTYHQWLTEQIRQDRSYQTMAKSLLTAVGDTHELGPPNFYRTVGGPREQAEFVSELFMGSRLRCANCHNHPLDRWTQDDYHGLAAIFAKVDVGRVVKLKPGGEVIHPQTLEAAVPKIPGERFLETKAEGRAELADWLTRTDNPYFAKAIVNRLWKRMMGRGLVEPTDDFRATNPATHPDLLDRLAEDFAENGFSFRHTLRTIATSEAYGRSVKATEENQDDDRFYSHALRRPLEPEVLADAISDALGVPEKYGNEPLGARAVALIDPRTPSRSLQVLGRCNREESCESGAPATGGLPQKLHLFNGKLLNARISAERSRLVTLHKRGVTPQQIIHEFYLAALSRPPTKAEIEHWHAATEKANDTNAFLEDFVWGLMTSREFVTNH